MTGTDEARLEEISRRMNYKGGYENWAIITVAPLTEENIERWLRRGGYRTYLPLRRRIVFPAGRRNGADPRMLPLLPGYVFAQDWHGWPNPRFHPAPGSTMKLLIDYSTGKPSELRSGDLNILRGIELDQDAPWPNGRGRPRNDIQPGDEVETPIGGDYWHAKLVSMTEQGRAVISMMLFGRESEIEVAASDLQKVE